MENVAVRGRPREFDVDDALAAALRVFWTNGYEGSSLTDLTDAMGITRPSLYAAFGNKEELFTRALDLYEREKLAYIREALDAPTTKGMVANLLHGAIDLVSGDCRGCLGVTATVTCGAEDSSIRQHIEGIAANTHRALVERIEKGISAGDFDAPADPEALANYLKTVLQGLSVQARSGMSRSQLESVAQAAVAIWPSR
ncbi:TetR/AcrR family transcriptional regulator [Croceibacterium aestuarii]|uniref:TetR/AcrR family transcriptional regulator n=1 Tax=Croceibacterium aestuarii TaxID=3064139 RepID=UPI00272E306E|nr:TetR/AcrR family transcriptional regulator [Croceibacterium sp. D39]